MLTKLDQGGCLGFQLDGLGSVFVGSQPLDEMTQAQSSDQLQIGVGHSICVEVHEIQQVEGSDFCDARQNLAGSHCGCCIAAIDGGPNSTFLDQSRPQLFGPAIPSSACGIDGGLRRFTEIELNEQSLPVAECAHYEAPEWG